MNKNKTITNFLKVALIGLCLCLSACLGSVVGAVVDTTIEVVKVPFKVGGAVIDVVTPDKLNMIDDHAQEPNMQASDSAAIRSENESL